MTLGGQSTPGLRDAGPESSFRVDLRVYSLAALKKAVYGLGDVASASLLLLDDAEARVDFMLAEPPLDPGAFRRRFFRELLDQDLRESIARETEALRNLIVAHALSKVPLLHPELETDSPDLPAQPGVAPSTRDTV